MTLMEAMTHSNRLTGLWVRVFYVAALHLLSSPYTKSVGQFPMEYESYHEDGMMLREMIQSLPSPVKDDTLTLAAVITFTDTLRTLIRKHLYRFCNGKIIMHSHQDMMTGVFSSIAYQYNQDVLVGIQESFRSGTESTYSLTIDTLGKFEFLYKVNDKYVFNVKCDSLGRFTEVIKPAEPRVSDQRFTGIFGNNGIFDFDFDEHIEIHYTYPDSIAYSREIVQIETSEDYSKTVISEQRNADGLLLNKLALLHYFQEEEYPIYEVVRENEFLTLITSDYTKRFSLTESGISVEAFDSAGNQMNYVYEIIRQ